MNLHNHPIAVCSWSLQPKGMEELVAKTKELGLADIQLALGELVQLDDKRKYHELGHLRAGGLHLTGGMMAFAGEDYSTIERIRQTGGFVPDDQWPLRKRLCIEAAKLARELNCSTITTHVGFVPLRADPRYAIILARVRELAQAFAGQGIELLMETGQEPAAELLHFLTDIAAPNVHVNFDPANMILYGAGDPIDAIRTLGSHIRHVHVKDGTPSANPGVEWGAEVPFGAGAVGPQRFLDALRQIHYAGPLAIEREAGNQRMADVRAAIDVLQAQ
ncbi:MAG TPA: sugar phosphate isomerase/epimerase family protein [Tepidisphaeraceae bacterium]|nr:sugar phosphate isomerase/epimerase family protein [Tepidisphaeraceae bacterium]